MKRFGLIAESEALRPGTMASNGRARIEISRRFRWLGGCKPVLLPTGLKKRGAGAMLTKGSASPIRRVLIIAFFSLRGTKRSPFWWPMGDLGPEPAALRRSQWQEGKRFGRERWLSTAGPGGINRSASLFCRRQERSASVGQVVCHSAAIFTTTAARAGSASFNWSEGKRFIGEDG